MRSSRDQSWSILGAPRSRTGSLGSPSASRGRGGVHESTVWNGVGWGRDGEVGFLDPGFFSSLPGEEDKLEWWARWTP